MIETETTIHVAVQIRLLNQVLLMILFLMWLVTYTDNSVHFQAIGDMWCKKEKQIESIAKNWTMKTKRIKKKKKK